MLNCKRIATGLIYAQKDKPERKLSGSSPSKSLHCLKQERIVFIVSLNGEVRAIAGVVGYVFVGDCAFYLAYRHLH